jgi:hypothetical protein
MDNNMILLWFPIHMLALGTKDVEYTFIWIGFGNYK